MGGLERDRWRNSLRGFRLRECVCSGSFWRVGRGAFLGWEPRQPRIARTRRWLAKSIRGFRLVARGRRRSKSQHSLTFGLARRCAIVVRIKPWSLQERIALET